MLRKLTLISLILVLFTLNGASCLKGPTGGEPQEQITLTMWGLFDSEEVFQPLINDFQLIHKNIKVNYIKKDFDEYELKTSEALAAGTGPDIWMIRNDWMPRHYEKLVPLSEGVINIDKKNKSDLEIYKDKFAPIAATENIIDEKIYGIPFSIDTLALYYNQDIFRAKIKQFDDEKKTSESRFLENPPQTWDDVIRTNEMLTIKNGNNISRSGLAFGTAGNTDHSQDILAMFMLQNRTEMVSADKQTATFNLPIQKASGEPVYAGTKALEFYTGFSNPSKQTYSWNNSMPNSIDAFIDGKAAMMINYSYLQKVILQRAPNLNYAIAPLPQIKGTTQFVDYASYWTETVTKNSKHPKEAWEFIKYVAIDRNDSYTSATKRPNPFRIIEGNLPKNLSDRLNMRGTTFDFQKMTAKNWFKGKHADKVDIIFSDMIDNITLRGQNFQTTIDAAAANITALLKEYYDPTLAGMPSQTPDQPVETAAPSQTQ